MKRNLVFLLPLVLILIQCSPETIVREVVVTRIIKEVDQIRITVPIEVTRLVTVVEEKEVTRIIDRLVTVIPQEATSNSNNTATNGSATTVPVNTNTPRATGSTPTPIPTFDTPQPTQVIQASSYNIVDARIISEDEYSVYLQANLQGLIADTYWYNLRAKVPDSPLSIGYQGQNVDAHQGIGEVGLIIDRLICTKQFSTQLVELELIGGPWPCPNNYCTSSKLAEATFSIPKTWCP